MNILVTGGAGFIGSHIAESLIQYGHNVTVLDNFSTGRIENVPDLARCLKIDLLELSDPALQSLIINEYGPFDCIYHQAAHMELRKSVNFPIHDLRTNVEGTINILELLKRQGHGKLIAASSSAIYGNSVEQVTEHSITSPISPYGCSKLSMEHYIDYYRSVHGVDSVILRYMNVYGPRQNPLGESGLPAIIINNHYKGIKTIIHGDGSQTRDWVYVKDVAQANLLALDYNLSGSYVISSGIDWSVNSVIAEIERSINGIIDFEYGPYKLGDASRTLGNSAKFITDTDFVWTPLVSLSNGISETVKTWEIVN